MGGSLESEVGIMCFHNVKTDDEVFRYVQRHTVPLSKNLLSFDIKLFGNKRIGIGDE
jgi:hypothetical protein